MIHLPFCQPPPSELCFFKQLKTSSSVFLTGYACTKSLSCPHTSIKSTNIFRNFLIRSRVIQRSISIHKQYIYGTTLSSISIISSITTYSNIVDPVTIKVSNTLNTIPKIIRVIPRSPEVSRSIFYSGSNWKGSTQVAGCGSQPR